MELVEIGVPVLLLRSVQMVLAGLMIISCTLLQDMGTVRFIKIIYLK